MSSNRKSSHANTIRGQRTAQRADNAISPPSRANRDAKPYVHHDARPLFRPGDCVRVCAPSEMLTVESQAADSVSLVYLSETGELKRFFLDPRYLAVVKARGRRPEVGDLVRLPSGSPLMKLVRYDRGARDADTVLCKWREGEKEKSAWHNVNLLEVVE